MVNELRGAFNIVSRECSGDSDELRGAFNISYQWRVARGW